MKKLGVRLMIKKLRVEWQGDASICIDRKGIKRSEPAM
jgi:hypothetical protein